MTEKFTFNRLVDSIQQIHGHLSAQTNKAINISLTLRNWAIGSYIRKYEQNGADRAEYGGKIFIELSQKLAKLGNIQYHPRELRRCRTFYEMYPQIGGTLSPEFQIPAENLVNSLSFSHFVALIKINNPLKRVFYEIECIRGNWSVRELKRQISSLYYERSGLSKDKKKLAELVRQDAECSSLPLTIRDPYVFEFLGIKLKDVMSESGLEDSLLDKLQEFLLELGYGFCFEARQKRILIGDTYCFIDLVFYHRVLKCHMLIDLKVDEFSHQHLGQLNTYINWYQKNMMSKGDNLPIGILLCTHKDHALVEYALAGMDNNLFVSKYQLELPKKKDIRQFLEKEMKEVEQIGPGTK